MNKTVNIGIRGHLFLGFAIKAILLVLAIMIILVKVTAIENITEETIDVDMATHEATFELALQLTQAQSILRGWILIHDPLYKTEFTKTWENIKGLRQKLDNLSEKWSGDVQQWHNVDKLLTQLYEIQNQVISMDNNDAIIAFWKTKVLPLVNRLADILLGSLTESGNRRGGMLDQQYDKMKTQTSSIINNISAVRTTAYILLLVIVIVSFFIAMIVSRRITFPLNHAVEIAKKIAAGERDVDIQIIYQDETRMLFNALKSMQTSIKKNEEQIQQSEIKANQLSERISTTAENLSKHSSRVAAGDLRQRLDIVGDDVMAKLGVDLNTMTENLSSMTKQISEASHHMVTTIEEVQRTIEMQSSGAAEQAASINEITVSLQEIEKSSSQTMEKAKLLGVSAEQTREKGQLGLEAIEESVDGMKFVRDKVQLIAQTILELSHQTQQVGEITDVVNNLAQQSKMLALNASIEAAKAGEAGKGFSVVASEVKNLAEQSEQSTTLVRKILDEIRHVTEKAVMMTEEGTKSVDDGTLLVEKSGDIMRTLNEVIQEATIASQQIEAAVHQEGIGIEQIAAGMHEINQVTATFVEGVKQSTEAINGLVGTAQSLKNNIDLYQI